MYVGLASGRVKTVAKGLSVVPFGIGGALYVKAAKLAALAPMVKYPIYVLCGFQCVIPLFFYVMARRYIFSMTIINEGTEKESFQMKSLSMNLWVVIKNRFKKLFFARSSD